MIKTYLDNIKFFAPSHLTDAAKVSALVDAIQSGSGIPAILVVADDGNGALVLDGHHRAAAANELGVSIPANVIDYDEFWTLINDEFDGDIPARISDIDEHIEVNGKPYGGRD